MSKRVNPCYQATSNLEIMKTLEKFVITLTLLCASFATSMAQDSVATTQPVANDTVYFYNSWAAMLAHKPDFAYAGNLVFGNNEYEMELWAQQEQAQKNIEETAIAACVGDSLWLVNANYLLSHFKSKYSDFKNYIPLYFSAKVAFVRYWTDYPIKCKVRPMINFDGEEVMEPVLLHNGETPIYIIDFSTKTICKLDHKLLTQLLEPYPELQRRYLGMKRHKDTEIIEFFFEKYLNKLNSDPMTPKILDFENSKS